MKIQGTWLFTEKEKKTIASLVEKGREEQKRNDKFAIIDFDNFYKLFTKDEITLLEKYLAIEAKDISYKLPYLGLVNIPRDIVPIVNQTYQFDKQKHIIPCQYIPSATYKAYEKLNKVIHKELDKRLLVLYGYRSPARQVFMFFDILERLYNFDFDKTIKRVCLPAHSEHTYPKKQAIDFVTTVGMKGEGFEKTDEYVWLQKNAKNFGFIESYGKNNDLGIMYEPWHWRHDN